MYEVPSMNQSTLADAGERVLHSMRTGRMNPGVMVSGHFHTSMFVRAVLLEDHVYGVALRTQSQVLSPLICREWSSCNGKGIIHRTYVVIGCHKRYIQAEIYQ